MAPRWFDHRTGEHLALDTAAARSPAVG